MAEQTPTLPFADALKERVGKLEELFNLYALDGFKIREILSFFYVSTFVLAELSRAYDTITRRERKAIILETIRDIYNARNPNLPWIIEPFETFFEQMILDYILPQLYDAVVVQKSPKDLLEDLLTKAHS